MIQVFLDESPALLERTRKAIAARDCVAAQRSAHTLRGALANFAAREASATAHRLEGSAEQGDWVSVVDAHAKLEEQMHDVVRLLTAFACGGPR
jgi:HPt (histidine-containing phosphotransfer) domain-containing protein